METFNAQHYLRNMPDWLPDLSVEELRTLQQEARQKIEQYHRQLQSSSDQLFKWKQKLLKFRQGQRKTYPKPENGGVNIEEVREQHRIWCAGYWEPKLRIINEELKKRGVRVIL